MEGDLIDKQQLISSILGMGKYIDTRIKDAYFKDEVDNNRKSALSVQHVYFMDDSLCNQSFS